MNDRTETPDARLSRAERMLDLRRQRGSIRLADLESLVSDIRELVGDIREMEAERDEDIEIVAEVCADYGNAEGPREIRRLYAQFEERIIAAGAR